MTGHAIEALKRNRAEMTGEIAQMVTAQWGLGLGDETGILNIIIRRVGGGVLHDKRSKGLVRLIEKTGPWLQWEIVR